MGGGGRGSRDVVIVRFDTYCRPMINEACLLLVWYN